MNRRYEESEARDKFITDHLIADLIGRIEGGPDSGRTAERVASMYIFPYKTKSGTMLGSLLEPGTMWYFTRSDENNRLSTDSYRILDDSVLKPELSVRLRETFVEHGKISEFSNDLVIKDLLVAMSTEQEYTPLWWEHAYDVLQLWEKDKSQIRLDSATKGIKSKRFLFLPDYCPDSLKRQLIALGVYSDVRTADSERLFWRRIPKNAHQKAITMLKDMGVPHAFARGEEVDSNILSFVKRIASEVTFPVSGRDSGRAMCNVCHELFFGSKGIIKRHPSAFDHLSEVQDGRNEGIPVLNIFDEYVPLSWDLFYSEDDAERNSRDETGHSGSSRPEQEKTAEQKLLEAPVEYEGDFERLRIHQRTYSLEITSHLHQVHSFSGITEPFSNYRIPHLGDATNFYKWVWGYSKHGALVRNILCHFSGKNAMRKPIPDTDSKFVLAVISKASASDEYSFDINLRAREAFHLATLINRIGCSRKRSEFPNVYTIVRTNARRHDCDELLRKIFAVAPVDRSLMQKMLSDEIWEHVYLVNGETDAYDGAYVQAMRAQGDSGYEEALLLWPSYSSSSYKLALARFLDDTYGTSMAGLVERDVDWEEAYRNLIDGIRGFMDEVHPTIPIDATYMPIAPMDDVRSFGEEKRIWQSLHVERERTLAQRPGDLDGWKEFLSRKYVGRCQLCGERIAMGPQRNFFWTYRIVKGSKNELADLESNLFCLCPACHGKMDHGRYMGHNLNEVASKAQQYVEYLEAAIESDNREDHFRPCVEELADETPDVEGFYRPIALTVVVNGGDDKGDPQTMAFSWEHFIRLAFVFAHVND